MLKKSTGLLITLLIMLTLLVIDFSVRLTLAVSARNDASIINHLGIIRGSIQRLSKYELSDIQRNDIVNTIEEKIRQYDADQLRIGTKGTYHQLSTLWVEFVDVVQAYRDQPDSYHRELLLENSERLWDTANTVVSEAQLMSEMRMKYTRMFILSSVIHLVLLLLIIFFVKLYVRDKLESMALIDPLTKAYNRKYLNEFLANEIDRMKRNPRALSILLFDIDHFKRVNDQYGHDAGDLVLRELAEVVKGSIRKSDVLARYGGEEFIVVLPDTEASTARTLAERLRGLVEEHLFKGVNKVTISLGVASYQKDDEMDQIIKRADLGLYYAKEHGRNQVGTE